MVEQMPPKHLTRVRFLHDMPFLNRFEAFKVKQQAFNLLNTGSSPCGSAISNEKERSYIKTKTRVYRILGKETE